VSYFVFVGVCVCVYVCVLYMGACVHVHMRVRAYVCVCVYNVIYYVYITHILHVCSCRWPPRSRTEANIANGDGECPQPPTTIVKLMVMVSE